MNLRRLQLLTAVMFTLMFTGVMFGQRPNWRIPITVTHVANIGLDTLGYDSAATYCTDPLLGETELPPKPPLGVFDTRFVDSRDGASCLGQGQRLHLQAKEFGLDTFQLTFQKGDPVGTNTWSVSWPAGLSDSWKSLRLTDAIGIGAYDVDMLTTTSVTITQAFITAVNIVGEPDGVTAVAPENDLIPGTFRLQQNYPNPFNPSTTIKFAVAKASFADVAVFDVLGRRIATLASEDLKPGYYTTTWNGSDDNGVAVSSGVYYVRMVASGDQNVNFSAVQKLLLMK